MVIARQPFCWKWLSVTKVSKYGKSEYSRALNESYTFQPLMSFCWNLIIVPRTPVPPPPSPPPQKKSDRCSPAYLKIALMLLIIASLNKRRFLHYSVAQERYTQGFIQDNLFRGTHNRPFYRCGLSTLAYEWMWGWGCPYFDTNLLWFVMEIGHLR